MNQRSYGVRIVNGTNFQVIVLQKIVLGGWKEIVFFFRLNPMISVAGRKGKLMRAIDADRLLRDIEEYHVSDGKFQHWVQIQPSIELRCEECEAFNKTRLLIPQPERKNGKWVRCDTDRFRIMRKCSECVARIDIQEEFRSFFCYHCGADMRGEQDE